VTDPSAPEPEPPLDVRDHRIEVPRSALWWSAGGEAGVSEIWVVLHGFGMLARNFIGWFRPAVTPHRLVVAPEALNRYYLKPRERKVGATWMTSHDRLAEIADYVRYLDLLLAEVRREFDAPTAPVQVHAFSQGAATGCRWVALGEVRPARLVLWGGGVPPDLDLAAHGDSLSAAGLTVVLGDRDEYITEADVDRESVRLQEAGVRVTMERFRGGHVIPWPVLERLAGS